MFGPSQVRVGQKISSTSRVSSTRRALLRRETKQFARQFKTRPAIGFTSSSFCSSSLSGGVISISNFLQDYEINFFSVSCSWTGTMTETSLIWIIGYPLRVFELPLSAVMKIYKQGCRICVSVSALLTGTFLFCQALFIQRWHCGRWHCHRGR